MKKWMYMLVTLTFLVAGCNNSAEAKRKTEDVWLYERVAELQDLADDLREDVEEDDTKSVDFEQYQETYRSIEKKIEAKKDDISSKTYDHLTATLKHIGSSMNELKSNQANYDKTFGEALDDLDDLKTNYGTLVLTKENYPLWLKEVFADVCEVYEEAVEVEDADDRNEVYGEIAEVHKALDAHAKVDDAHVATMTKVLNTIEMTLKKEEHITLTKQKEIKADLTTLAEKLGVTKLED
ncbi:MAG: hypothetical protein ACRC5C_03480 [Bacilli bacterium]